jgi:hypothetical protein
MTLYDLMNGTTLQGHIEVKKLDEDGNELKSCFYENCEDLSGVELPNSWEDCNVTYIYPQKLTRRHWTWVEETSCLVIEVSE